MLKSRVVTSAGAISWSDRCFKLRARRGRQAL